MDKWLPWKNPTAIFLSVALVLLFWDSIASLYNLWTIWDGALSHGIPVAVLFLHFYLSRVHGRQVGASLTISALNYLLLFICLFVWGIARLIHLELIEQLSLIPIFVLMNVLCFGWLVVWQNRYVFLLLIYIVPIWDYINTDLVQLSSTVVGWMVANISMPAVIEGNSIHLPFGQIVIADGCSGLRYLEISLCLAQVICVMNNYKERNVIFALSVATILGLVTNWLRIFILVVIGYETEMTSSLMEDHEMFGWVLFGLIALPVIYFSPVVKVELEKPQVQKLEWLQYVKTVSLPCVVVFFVAFYTVSPKGTVKADLLKEPFLSNFSGLPFTPSLPKTEHVQSYRLSQSGVYAQINQYFPSSSMRQIVPYMGHQFPIESWITEQSEIKKIGSRLVKISLIKRKQSVDRFLQAQWFEVGGATTPSYAGAKLLQIPAVLTRNYQFNIYTLQIACEVNSLCKSEEDQLSSAIRVLELQ